MKDSEIKNLFTNVNIPAPRAGFEDMIIAKALKPKRSFFAAYASIAAIFLFVLSTSFISSGPHTDSSKYAYILDESIAADEDIYDGLI